MLYANLVLIISCGKGLIHRQASDERDNLGRYAYYFRQPGVGRLGYLDAGGIKLVYLIPWIVARGSIGYAYSKHGDGCLSGIQS